MVLIAIFIVANLVQRDIGSGVRILVQGWPFPAATNHLMNGLTVHWIGLLANVVAGVALIGIGTIVIGKLRRLLTQKTESQINRKNAV